MNFFGELIKFIGMVYAQEPICRKKFSAQNPHNNAKLSLLNIKPKLFNVLCSDIGL